MELVTANEKVDIGRRAADIRLRSARLTESGLAGRLENEESPSRRGSGGQHRRIEIVRNKVTGISIVSDESQVVI